MTMPSMGDMEKQTEEAKQQAAAFRQATGGVCATVYMQRGDDRLTVVVRMSDGSSPGGVLDALVGAVGMVCQQLGMTVKT